MRFLSTLFRKDSTTSAALTQEELTVLAHVIDIPGGYTEQTLVVGRDIPQDQVQRYGENGEVFIVIEHTEPGKANRVTMKREMWEKLKRQFDQVDRGMDRLEIEAEERTKEMFKGL